MNAQETRQDDLNLWASRLEQIGHHHHRRRRHHDDNGNR